MNARDAGALRATANEPAVASFERVETVAIIGAGVAGLVTAKTLLASGLRCTVFERNEILGGVWADGYANFGAQAPKELYEIPDWPLPAVAPNFTPGPILRTYLADYSDTFGITSLIRFGAEVSRIAARADGKAGWSVASRVGDAERREDFDLVVVCTGLYSNRPHMPEFPGQKTFTGEIIHNSALKSRGRVEGKRVAVLGFGKSATDAARESAAVATEISIVFRTPHWPVPQKLAGIVPFKWGTLHRLTSALIPPYQRVSGLERVIHGPGRPVAWLFWRMVEILLFFQCRLGSRFGTRVSLVPRAPIEVDSFGESTMVPRPELYRLIREGAINARRAEIAAYERDAVRLTDGTRLPIDVMILATGWRVDYGFFSQEVIDRLGIEEDGLYLYRHIVHPDTPNLAVVGANAATFESILTYCLQARWLAELIAGRHRLPAQEAMRRDIEEMKAWKRSWMPFSSSRGARILLHQLHYHDELLRDFGANPRRKRGFFAPLRELIDPYEPNDYASIVSGEWRSSEHGTRPTR